MFFVLSDEELKLREAHRDVVHFQRVNRCR